MNVQPLRYYDRRGRLAESMRSDGGHREYPPEAVTTLRIIKPLRGWGSPWTRWRRSWTRRAPSDRTLARLQRHDRAKFAEVDARVANLHTGRASPPEFPDAPSAAHRPDRTARTCRLRGNRRDSCLRRGGTRDAGRGSQRFRPRRAPPLDFRARGPGMPGRPHVDPAPRPSGERETIAT